MKTATVTNRAVATEEPSRLEHGTPQVSVVVPVLNEKDSVNLLNTDLERVLNGLGVEYEIIYVDDGSTDGTLEGLLDAARHNERIIVLELRRNFGQTAAMAAGINESRGDIVIPIDGDGQNDPRDIPALINKLHQPPGYDVVSGWRRQRRDPWLTRRLPSQIANGVIRRVTGVAIHDFGCTLKAYRREVLEGITLSSDLHRFLPALAVWNGARVTEMVVNHRPRLAGQAKYGLGRILRVLLDLVTVKFLGSYLAKPLLFFGKLALVTLCMAVCLFVVALGQKYGYFFQPQGVNLNRNVLVTLSALLIFLGVQCILLGIVSELLTRIYHDAKERPIYRLRRRYRYGQTPPGRIQKTGGGSEALRQPFEP